MTVPDTMTKAEALAWMRRDDTKEVHRDGEYMDDAGNYEETVVYCHIDRFYAFRYCNGGLCPRFEDAVGYKRENYNYAPLQVYMKTRTVQETTYEYERS